MTLQEVIDKRIKELNNGDEIPSSFDKYRFLALSPDIKTPLSYYIVTLERVDGIWKQV